MVSLQAEVAARAVPAAGGATMNPFRNVLVHLDSRPESQLALDTAARLAREDGASIAAVDALEPIAPLGISSIGDLGVPLLTANEITERLYEERRQRLESAVAPLAEAGIKVTSKVLWGSPFLAIIREVLAEGHDLVLRTAEGRSGFGGASFGATAMHLFRKCPVPVWALRPDGSARPAQRVVAAVDPDASDPARTRLAERVLSLALDLARERGSEVHVVRAWSLPGESVLRTTLGRAGVDRYAEAHEREVSRVLHAFLAGFGTALDRARVHLLRGPAQDVLPDFLADRGADLLVIGSVARTGVPGLFIGSTAERVLQRIDCSVIALKPDGFETPIRSSDG